MALTDLQFPEAEITVGDGRFSVRGLTFSDIHWLMGEIPAEVDALVAMMVEMTSEGGENNAEAALMARLQATRPVLAARIIACASGDTSPAAVSIAERLPAPCAIDALANIARLTFEVHGGIKKFVDVLAGVFLMVQEYNRQTAEPNTGSTDSDRP